MKKLILFLIISFSFINSFALTYGGCDYSTVSRMKSIVSIINISYDYKIADDIAYFNVTINNLTPDVYFYDTVTRKNYYYSNTNNGEITLYNYTNSGSYKFYSNNSSCYGISLGSRYYKFPQYNFYYSDPLCSDIPNYSLCQKWANVNYSRDEFEQMVMEYKNGKEVEEEITIEYEKTLIDKMVDIYIEYYYYFLGGIILILTPIIVVSNKKNRFKL